MTKSHKPTVWILDDQWDSALEKLSFFFSFTEAAIEGTDTPGGLQALEASWQSPGWALAALKPAQLAQTELRNGIVLVDVNWSAAASSEIGVPGMHPDEKRRFGITLAREIIARRRPEDNLDIVLFSHTAGDELTAFFFELTRQGVKRFYPVVISQTDAKGRRIRSYGCEARDRITGELLQKIPAPMRAKIGAGIRSRQAAQPGHACLQDFTGGMTGVSVDGISLTDLATPYLKQTQAELARASFNDANASHTRETIQQWLSLLIGPQIAFELDESLQNVPTALLRALLRYREVDHLDGFVLLQETTRGSRYADPAAALRKNLAADRSKLTHAPLFKGFKHKISVGLGTPIGKIKKSIAKNEPPPDLGQAFSPFEKLPPILKDPAILDYSDFEKNPNATAKLHLFDHGKTGLRIEISTDTIWENSLIQASDLLAEFLADPKEPTELLKIHALDPDNSQVCLEIARRGDTLLQHVPAQDPRWASAVAGCRTHALRLQRAAAALHDYSQELLQNIHKIPEALQKDFRLDIENSDARRKQWQDERETLEHFLLQFDLPETLAASLALILDRTDTNEGAEQLQNFLLPYLPRVRGYARTIIQKTLQRKGLNNTENLRKADHAFATIFPANDPQGSGQNWLSVALAALGPRIQSIQGLPDATFEKMVVPLLGKELLQQVNALEGYDFLEGSVEFHVEAELQN